MLHKPFRGTLLNKTHPITRGFIGCWLVNEGTGKKIFDLSGNSQHGTLLADTLFEPGKYGFRLAFDGTGDYITVDTNKEIGNGAYTVIARVQTRFDTENTRVIFGKRDTANPYSVELEINEYSIDVTQLALVRYDGSDAYKVLSGTNITTLTDYWVAGTWDGSKYMKLYVDGILKGTTDASAASDSSNTDDYSIGARKKSGSNLYWQGKIYYVYLWNRVLLAQEIAWLHRVPYAMFLQNIFRAFEVPAVPTANIVPLLMHLAEQRRAS